MLSYPLSHAGGAASALMLISSIWGVVIFAVAAHVSSSLGAQFRGGMAAAAVFSGLSIPLLIAVLVVMGMGWWKMEHIKRPLMEQYRNQRQANQTQVVHIPAGAQVTTKAADQV